MIGPGDRVRQKSSGRQGKVLRVEGEHVYVDGPDGEVRWNVRSCVPVVKTHGPRGRQPVTERMLAAARMVDEGVDRVEVMRLHGIERQELQAWIELVSEARADERNLRAIRRTG